MKGPNSEITSSENKREGLKYITQAVFQLLQENKTCTYPFICKNVAFPNVETLNRRIYDVLNVMKAVKLIDKKGKRYFLINSQEDVGRKREEMKKLMEMKKVFEFIVNRNSSSRDAHLERLYLPFMVISTGKSAEIHCETNEERTFFFFRSSKPLKVNEDLDVLREIYGRTFSEEKMENVLRSRSMPSGGRAECDEQDSRSGDPGKLSLDPFFF
jgi:hypothetical protein